ncbi:MAG: acyl-CoA thioesterase [Pseudomonadota bacterium]
MYPLFRLVRTYILARGAWKLNVEETHLETLRVWPWDIDVFMELNNGRMLTLMDLGRFGYFIRNGITTKLSKNGWYGTVAGTAVRYRRRITVFQKLELHTRVLGWDERFTYIDQSFWRGEECCAQAVIRTAIADGKGIVPTEQVAELLGYPKESPPLPDWVQAWAKAETQRPWPPKHFLRL